MNKKNNTSRRRYTPASSSVARRRQSAAIRSYYAEKRLQEIYPHFRLYLKSMHPALIVGEKDKDTYNFRKTSHDREGLRRSEKIDPNPNPNDPEPMYIEIKVRSDKKRAFGKKFPWLHKGK